MPKKITEKRLATRIPLQASSQLCAGSSNDWKECILIDVGLGGVGALVNNSAVVSNTPARFKIAIAAETIELSGIIRWSKTLQHSTAFNQAIGVCFTNKPGSQLFDFASSRSYAVQEEATRTRMLFD